MSARYLTPEQDAKLRRWERWNRNYFVFAFVALIVVLVFSSQLGISSGDYGGSLGVLLALRVSPIVVLQLRRRCPACGVKFGWQAKLMVPVYFKSCGVFLRSWNYSS